MRRRCLIVLTSFAFSAQMALPASGPPESGPVTDVSKIKEIDFSGLSEAQKKIALKVMNDKPCNCGCKMTVAICREKDESCRRSQFFCRVNNQICEVAF